MNPYGGHWEGDWGHWEGTGRHRSHMGPYWSILVHTGRLMLVPPPVAVVSIEDPFDQDDWEAWKRFVSHVDIQVVGDDLTVTNPKRIAHAAEQHACNCLLLKANQIGSVTESIQA